MHADRVGLTNINRHGTVMEIIQYNSSSDVLVRFRDENGAVVHTTYSNFKLGQVKNPYFPSVCGVGFVGQGPYKTKTNNVHTDSYTIWATMLQRCYSQKWMSMFPAYYHKATVCDEWKNYQNFARWYEENRYEVPARLHIDKDILCQGNSIYSPSTCLLVPQRLNMLFCGKEKTGAEYAAHVIDVATQYKDIVPENVYNAIMDRACLMAKKG